MPRRTVQLDASQLVPGGILETDRWFEGNEPSGPCSRCGREPEPLETCLMIRSADRTASVRYCASCTECGA